MQRRAWNHFVAAVSLTIFVACVDMAGIQAEIRSVAASAEQSLVTIKRQVMSADYCGDLAELARLRDEASSLAHEPATAHLAHYWAGFAGWRLAMNGSSRAMNPKEMRAHLVRAVGHFQASICQRDDFADGYAAAGSAMGWLAALNRDDPASLRGHVAEVDRLLARARELGPDNPRVLWVLGINKSARPPHLGGDRQQAMALYRRALEHASEPQPQSPLPDWGKAEAHMVLADMHLNSDPPDLVTAHNEAQAALQLQPEWSYVRDTLLPQIERAQAKGARSVQ